MLAYVYLTFSLRVVQCHSNNITALRFAAIVHWYLRLSPMGCLHTLHTQAPGSCSEGIALPTPSLISITAPRGVVTDLDLPRPSEDCQSSH